MDRERALRVGEIVLEVDDDERRPRVVSLHVATLAGVPRAVAQGLRTEGDGDTAVGVAVVERRTGSGPVVPDPVVGGRGPPRGIRWLHRRRPAPEDVDEGQ